MNDAPDVKLLEQFARNRSESAFAELVKRHISLVYSVAFRKTGNPQQAEDVTQAVFIILARKAGSLGAKTVLPGWLYHTARLTAANTQRAEARRFRHEQEAFMQSMENECAPDELWRELSPLLEDAMAGLGAGDRDALVLRYFQNRRLADVGAALGVSEGVAQRRVSRALEKLRRFFARRGVHSTSAIIAGALSSNFLQAAPPALAQTVTAAALAKGAAASASTITLVKGALKLMAMTTLQKTIIGVALAAAIGTGLFQAHQAAKLRAQNLALQQQRDDAQKRLALLSAKPALHLPAPQIQFVPPPTPVPIENAPTNLYAWLKGNPKLTREQAEAFLNKNGRTAANLVAAFRTSRDPAFLHDAMQNYPNDPQVDFEALFYGNLSPEQQRQWLNTFENSDPNNALANYLSALNYFNAGQMEQGVQEITAASSKPLQDYTLNRLEDDEEAYLGAGYSQINSDALAVYSLYLPQLGQLKQLGSDMVQLGQSYSQSGDQASAQSAFQMAANLGQRYADPYPGEAIISQLVGTISEQNALQAMDPGAPYGNGGQTVQDALDQLAQEKTALRQLGKQGDALMPTLTDQDNVIYYNRFMMFGEQNALQWLVAKYGKQ